MARPPDHPETMRQVAPYPHALAALVATFAYRPGWEFALADIDRGQGSQGLTLIITTLGYDTYHPDRGRTYRVHHYMPVPPAAYDTRSWRWWLRQQCAAVDLHEGNEFHVEDGQRPFAPNHGPGNDPYMTVVTGTLRDAGTSFRGDFVGHVVPEAISATLAGRLAGLSGRWVAVDGDQVVAVGDSAQDALDHAPGPSGDPLVFRVPWGVQAWVTPAGCVCRYHSDGAAMQRLPVAGCDADHREVDGQLAVARGDDNA